MAVTDTWSSWSSTAASNSPAGSATPEIDDEFRNIKAQVKGNVPVVCSQAEQQTGTEAAKFVSPSTQQFHKSAAKLYATVTVSGGTPSLTESYNVTSITDVDTGKLTVTIANDMSTGSFATVATPFSTQCAIVVTAEAGTAFTVWSYNFSGTVTEPVAYYLACFGVLA